MCCSWKEEIWIPPSGGATKVECALAHVGFGRAAAGQEIKKLSFDRISRRVTGDQTIAVVAWHGPQQPLWPMTCQSAVASNDRCTLQPAIDPLTARSAATVALRADAPQHQMVRNLAVVSLAKWLQSSAKPER